MIPKSVLLYKNEYIISNKLSSKMSHCRICDGIKDYTGCHYEYTSCSSCTGNGFNYLTVPKYDDDTNKVILSTERQRCVNGCIDGRLRDTICYRASGTIRIKHGY